MKLASMLNVRIPHASTPVARPPMGGAMKALRSQAEIARSKSDLSLFEAKRPSPRPPSGDAFFTKVDDGAAMQQTLARYQADMERYRAQMGIGSARESSASDCGSSFSPAVEEDFAFHAPEVKAEWDAFNARAAEEAGAVDEAGGGEQDLGQQLGKMVESAGQTVLKTITDSLTAPFKFLGSLFGF